MKESEQNKEKTAKDETSHIIPRFGKKGPSKLRQSFSRGMTYFLVVAACIVLYFAFLRADILADSVRTVIGILKPIIYGFAIAYLLNPIVKTVDKYLFPILGKKLKKQKTAEKLSRMTGILLALVFLFAIILALCNMLIPELARSIENLITTLPAQMNAGMDKLTELQSDKSTTGMIIKNLLNHATESFQNWIQADLLRQINVIMTNLTTGAINILNEVFQFLIGCIVSVYVLLSKELFAAQAKKIIYAVMTTDHANMTLHITRKSNEIFGGFIIGKIIDSAIIGVLCFLGITLLDMPYVVLVSVIVGVTNVIPFFGPYIGAIPCIILIGLTDPLKGLYFAIFILLLQQLDGNVIGPKILGDSTGLSAFWVVFSILLGGGLFGFVGMIAGVPTFAVLYYIFKMIIENKLEKKKLPCQTAEYGDVDHMKEDGSFVYIKEENKKKGED